MRERGYARNSPSDLPADPRLQRLTLSRVAFRRASRQLAYYSAWLKCHHPAASSPRCSTASRWLLCALRS
jgi:hypothetical protein